MQGMQPALYHRYGVLDDIDDDDEEGGDAAAATGLGGSGDYSGAAYGTMLAAAMQNMDISGDGGSGSNGGSGGGAGSSGEGLDGVVLGDVVREREVEGLGGGESGSGQGTGGSWSLLAHPGGWDVCCLLQTGARGFVRCTSKSFGRKRQHEEGCWYCQAAHAGFPQPATGA